ncbi:amine oxidase-like protein [Plasmopara halstedii]|uniref:Amine oxidase-like protein n=1 Tax=Plasmopara halstedii TaxID=4781 RepID=A0A0P1AT21_PLAHL|nr:amine oxidase-like protein [Plasmopara halstedii]CEG45281.1 amine oxidase-like protein [Plasmopara halstedii]|eukprot:XP_024581650.1 amine oxidase-like protein [Plasmopara halstedii]
MQKKTSEHVSLISIFRTSDISCIFGSRNHSEKGDGGPTEPAPDGGIGYYFIGDQKRMLMYDDDDEEFIKLNQSVSDLSTLENIDNIPHDKSMRDYFSEVGLSSSMMKLCEAGYANTAGGPLENISQRTTCRYEKMWIELEDDGDYRVVPSLMRFIDYFAEGVMTRFNWPVANVDYSQSDRILLTSTSGKQLLCKALVVTVSIAVFSKIAYSPPLPQQKLNAVKSFDMRRAGKVILHMSGQFWPENAHGVICSDCFLPEFWFNSTQGIGHLKTNGDKQYVANVTDKSADSGAKYLITGFASALYAEKFIGMDHDEIVEGFLDQLDMIYGTVDEPFPARKNFVKGIYKDWGDEPWICGGYAYPRVGQSDSASSELAAPVDNRLFFAGEATAFEQPGMSVHAAVDTGTRAAAQVTHALMKL